jgi:hypothetical protein
VTRTHVIPPAERRVPLPAAGVLSAWSAHDWRGGIHVDDLIALECLRVTTENSRYEIVLLSPETAEILVKGGAFFPVFTRVRLAGSSLGGSFLKLRSVHVGFRLEFTTERGFIITSPVRSVERALDTDPSDIM